MSLRLLPKEPVMLRDTSGQDRVIERRSPLRRHRKILIGLGRSDRGAHSSDRRT
jgi:hypothetical protein